MRRVVRVGDHVTHWFAGKGTVRRVIGAVCHVDWSDGSDGWAWTKDCRL